MKRFCAILLTLLLLAAPLAGCGSEPAAETVPTTQALPTLPPETEAPETLTEAPTEPVTEPATEAPPETTLSPEELERQWFYDCFWELDPAATDQWLAENPQYFAEGYAGVAVNEAWLADKGLELYTNQGHQVLAIDAKTGVLILRVWPGGSRGVLAIARDSSRLHLCAAEKLGSMGERIGSIARRNNGLLAMTGSGFLDPDGNGNGGQIAGACRCGGEDYGRPFGWNYARFELLADGHAIISHADGDFTSSATDAMEFEPALLIEGELQDPGIWTGENPRACIGQNRRGEILMLGVEGRFSDSPGCSVTECAKLLLEYEGWNAMNVDGGTTAILWYRGEPILRCSNRSTPEGRYLPNAWVYTKPEN